MKYLILFLLSFSIMAKEHIVEMRKMKFVPKIVEVKNGDTVKFINKDKSLHNVVIEDLKIKSKFLKKEQHFIVKLEKNGDFKYYCQPHKTMGMIGEIKVSK